MSYNLLAMSDDAPSTYSGMGLRCEGCGYVLGGLAETGNCPECGRAIARSKGWRRVSEFETSPSAGSFLRTTSAVLFRPGRFFGSLKARSGGRAGVWFARLYRALAAALFAAAVSGHVVMEGSFTRWLRDALTPAGGATYETFTINLFVTRFYWMDEPALFGVMLAPLAVLVYLSIAGLTHVVARVIARMCGEETRLHKAVVLRGLGFHGVHLVPVGSVLASTVGGYAWLVDSGRINWPPGILFPPAWDSYAWVLGVGALVGLGYVLITGWIAMRGMRYAND
jgi:hypothetical protein